MHPYVKRSAGRADMTQEASLMRHFHLIPFGLTVLVVLGLAACGGSSEPEWTERGRPPADPSDWTWGVPSSQMAEETETLIADQRGDLFASPDCVGTKSLDGTGEYRFDCTAKDRGRGERVEIEVTVFGSKTGEPELGGIISY